MVLVDAYGYHVVVDFKRCGTEPGQV